MAKKDTDLNVGLRSPAEDDAVIAQIIKDAEDAGKTVDIREDGSVWIIDGGVEGLSIASRVK